MVKPTGEAESALRRYLIDVERQMRRAGAEDVEVQATLDALEEQAATRLAEGERADATSMRRVLAAMEPAESFGPEGSEAVRPAMPGAREGFVISPVVALVAVIAIAVLAGLVVYFTDTGGDPRVRGVTLNLTDRVSASAAPGDPEPVFDRAVESFEEGGVDIAYAVTKTSMLTTTGERRFVIVDATGRLTPESLGTEGLAPSDFILIQPAGAVQGRTIGPAMPEETLFLLGRRWARFNALGPEAVRVVME